MITDVTLKASLKELVDIRTSFAVDFKTAVRLLVEERYPNFQVIASSEAPLYNATESLVTITAKVRKK